MSATLEMRDGRVQQVFRIEMVCMRYPVKHLMLDLFCFSLYRT
jgi:hypothetical protein